MGRTPQHGTYSGYNAHMERRAEIGKDGKPIGKRHRIDRACMEANARQQDKYRRKVYLNGGKLKVPVAGTRRRIQALLAIGYNLREIGPRIGSDPSSLSNIARDKFKTHVFPTTAEKLRGIYDELSMLPPTMGDWRRGRSRTFAQKMGYVSPLAWDDETIDDPYGLPMGLTHHQAYDWFWKVASMSERIEWVLEYGLAVTRYR